MAKKKLPITLEQLEDIAQAQIATLVLIQSAIQQIPDLPQQPYKLAFTLANEQLNSVLKSYAKRTSEEQTQALFDRAYQAAQAPALKESNNVQE